MKKKSTHWVPAIDPDDLKKVLITAQVYKEAGISERDAVMDIAEATVGFVDFETVRTIVETEYSSGHQTT